MGQGKEEWEKERLIVDYPFGDAASASHDLQAFFERDEVYSEPLYVVALSTHLARGRRAPQAVPT